MASSYNMYTPGSTGWSTFKKNEEFHEDDVWRIHSQTCKLQPEEQNLKRMNSNPTPSRNIPKSSSKKEPKLHQSAPVSIPDWSKIYGASYTKIKPSQKTSYFLDHGGVSEDDRVRESAAMNNRFWDSDEDDEDDEEDEEGKIIPPHEWIARRLARARISSFSVCEGIGRTLKGRDLSNVRNAVLTRTGFLEQLR